jgi:hypothetical protein
MLFYIVSTRTLKLTDHPRLMMQSFWYENCSPQTDVSDFTGEYE